MTVETLRLWYLGKNLVDPHVENLVTLQLRTPYVVVAVPALIYSPPEQASHYR